MKDFLRNSEAQLLHSVLPWLKQAVNNLSEGILIGLANMAFFGQLEQELHGLPECRAALEKLSLVGVVGEEDLAVGNVLIDLILAILGTRVGRAADLVAEAQEISDVSGDDRDGETVEVNTLLLS